MATVPISATNIKLLSGIPFNSDYKDTRWFDNRTQQTNYFNSRKEVHSISQSSFQRIDGRHFVKVNKSIDDLWGTNYLTFINRNKRFYAFVTNLEYINDGLTHVHFKIDVLQTWMFDLNFKPSYVLREHCKLWNDDGSPVINTIDEGLNYGTTYETVSVEHYKPYNDLMFLVVVTTETMHAKPGQETDKEIRPLYTGVPQPLSFYIHPFLLDGDTPNVKIGDKNYSSLSNVTEAIRGLSKQEGAVNNIVSMYVTEYIGHDKMSYNSTNKTLSLNSGYFDEAWLADGENENIQTIFVKAMGNYKPLEKNLGNKYSGFRNVSESKLMMYPYQVTILDDFKGNRIEVKNEYINGQNLILTIMGSMGTSNKVSYGVKNYLTSRLNETHKKIMGLENAVVSINPNDLPIINDLLSAYLQGNRNSIQNRQSQIEWNLGMNVLGGAIGSVSSAINRNPIGLASSSVSTIQGAGNSVYELQSIQSKIQDIDNVPANLKKMGGNTNYDYGNGISGVFVIKKQIHVEYRRILSDFFNKYGYKVNRVKIPNFHTRKYWNYVQTNACTITGNFNNQDLQELKNIFDNGITLWHTNDIGNYELSNEVI